MKLAVVVGTYKLAGFVELNILRCRRLLPGVPILLSDDRSPQSAELEALAKQYDCDYICSEKRRSHFSGDWQSFVNGIVFAREIGADVVVKLSQRLIPVLPEFFGVLDRVFDASECQVALPGQLNERQISRPTARFYRRFGLLTDAVAMRASAIDPEEMVSVYRERAGVGRKVSDSFSETSWGWLLENKFSGNKHCLLAEWTHHEPGKPKLYLRKSQSSQSDYSQIAKMEGLRDEFDLREWIQIEGRHGYKPKADQV